jgi:RNA polymerase sigma factor (sigma-70 family)
VRTEDGSIIQECLNGKPGAFGVLVDKYKEGIYAYVYTELRSFQDAQDITQEVFLQAYRDLRSLRRWDSFASWLYRIAYRRCMGWFRIRSRRVDGEFIEDQDPKVVDAPSLDSYRREQLGKSVREALDALPEIYREVLVLHYFGGMTIKDIAGAIGASPTAVGVRLNRARKQLREEMVAMMDTAFEGQKLPAGFTFRIVEAVRRIRIKPMPRMTGLPWGLSFAVGVMITVLSLNPHLSISSETAIPTGSLPPLETKVLRTGEIPVDVLEVSQVPLLASMRGQDESGRPDPQEDAAMAPQGEGGTWTRKADMQTSRRYHSACTVGGEIYVMGGTPDNKVIVSSVERYNPETDTWTYVADMPSEKWVHSASSVDGKVYVIGGVREEGKGYSIWPVLEYDPAKDVWREKSKTPIAVSKPCTNAVNGKIYVIGGLTHGDISISKVFEYDPGSDTWTQKADMPTARHAHASGVVNGKIYVVGGFGGKWMVMPDGTMRPKEEWPTLSIVEEYDPATDTWTRKSDMPTPRGLLCAGVLNEKIYAIGAGQPILNVVEEYDPAKDTWRRVNDMKTARNSFATSVANGKIYAIGGGFGGGPEPLVEEYTPEDWQPEVVSPQGKLPTKWGQVK